MNVPATILEVASPYNKGQTPHVPLGRVPLHAQPSAMSEEWASAWEGFELYLMSLQRSPLTINNRHSTVNVLARHMTAKGIEPAQVTKAVLSGFLLAEYKDRKPGGQQALYANLVVFWGWYSEEYGTPDPMKGLPRPKGEIPKVAIVTPENFEKVLEACGEGASPAMAARNRAIIWLMVESGLRRFEVCQLDLADVDAKQRTIIVRRGKGNKARVAVFGDATSQALWRYVTKFRDKDDGPLFQSAMGGRLTNSGMTQVLARVKKRSGVSIRPHMLRHTWCDSMLSAETPESVVMTLAGWSSGDMLRRYGAFRAQERAIAIGRGVQVGQRMKGK